MTSPPNPTTLLSTLPSTSTAPNSNSNSTKRTTTMPHAHYTQAPSSEPSQSSNSPRNRGKIPQINLCPVDCGTKKGLSLSTLV
ncbi:hypothetical protein IQ07DRAFT_378175 [Pyrenochaeta sp. DS3sAY3a]|nr:hypothetical protein IQ07DRAFT_378175 [Pyrenochaeta sp. DS3sAY3a]